MSTADVLISGIGDDADDLSPMTTMSIPADGPMSAPMERAFELARSVVGTVSPNPAVGAVLVRDGTVVGEGATCPPGGAHAEVVAIERANDAARGSTLYVTLEPCSVQGRTPPCTDAILSAGIKRVVVALRDADPHVDGLGIDQLRAAGVVVDVGDGTMVARRHYEAYVHHRQQGRPFVTGKFAASLDGKIAATSGDSRWISSPETRAWAHALRTEIDAILVGVSTVVVDDPELTARPNDTTAATHQPLRVVLDSRGRMSAAARVLRGQDVADTLVLTTSAASQEWQEQIEATGATVERVASDEGRVALVPALQLLAQRFGVVTLLVEGGGTIHGALFDLGLVDKVVAVLAPMIIGGDGAGAVGGRGATRMAEVLRLREVSVKQLGPDLLVSGYPQCPRAWESVTLRPAGLGDLECCLELAEGNIRPVAAQAAVRQAFERLQRDAGNVWLAMDEDRALGCLGLVYGQSDLHQAETGAFLEPLLTTAGCPFELEDRLIEVAEASAGGRGFDWLTVDVEHDDGEPRREWARRGYRYYRRAAGERVRLIKDLRSAGPLPARALD